MKRHYLFSAMIAAAMLAACSSEDVVSQKNDALNFGGEGEMQVSLTFNTGKTTRAANGFNGYQNGTAEESVARNAYFYFFNKDNGNYLGTSGEVKDLPQEEQLPDGGTIERKVNVPVPVKTINELKEGDTKVQVIAVLNPNAAVQTAAGKSYKEFIDAVLEETADPTMGFMMTNSVYSASTTIANPVNTDASDIVITAANVYQKGQKPANYEAVQIPVERVCAKVTLTADNEYTNSKGDKIVFKGWALNVLNTKYYAVKHLANIFANDTYPADLWTKVTPAWSSPDPDNKPATVDGRSFWAEDPNYIGRVKNVDKTDYPADFKVIDFANLDNKSGATQYCLENTFSNKGQYRDETTSAVILAQFTPEGKTEGADWVAYNGSNYSEKEFLNSVVGANNPVLKAGKYYIMTKAATADAEATYATISTENFGLVSEGEAVKQEVEGEGTVTIGYVGGTKIGLKLDKSVDGKIYTTADGKTFTETKDDVLALATQNVGRYTVYVGGYCYYVVPIRQFTDTEVPYAPTAINSASQIGRYGIVRNHAYTLNINSIVNAGNPIEGNEVTPEPGSDDQEEYLMDVSINCLPWAVRAQGIDL